MNSLYTDTSPPETRTSTGHPPALHTAREKNGLATEAIAASLTSLKMPHTHAAETSHNRLAQDAGLPSRTKARVTQARSSTEKNASNAERRLAKCRFWERGCESARFRPGTERSPLIFC